MLFNQVNWKYQIKLFYLLLAALMLLAMYFRSINILEMGIKGSDTFQYWHIATYWAKGELVFADPIKGDTRFFYRPLAYLIYSVVVKFFGQYDYSLKIVNIFADLVNIYLIFLVGRNIRGPWLGLLSAISYAFLPIIIQYSRCELLHILSESFILLSVWFLLKALGAKSKKLRFMFIGLAGMSFSCSMNIHTSLLYLGPGYLLFLLIYSLVSNKRLTDKLQQALANMLVFMSMFLLPYLIGGFIFGFSRIYNGMIGIGRYANRYTSDSENSQMLNFIDTMKSYLVDSTKMDLFVPFFVACMVIIAALLVFDLVKKRSTNKSTLSILLCIMLIVTCIAGNTFVINKKEHVRFFVPLVPLVFISVYGTICMVLDRLNFRKLALAAIVAITLLVLYNSQVFKYMRSLKQSSPSVYRELFNVLGEKVSAKEKLLLMPCSFHHTMGFSTVCYFGEDNVVYGRLCREHFDDLLHNNNVRYIFYVTHNKFMKWRDYDFIDYGTIEEAVSLCYGTTLVEKTPQWEIKAFYKVLGDRGRIIHHSPDGILIDLSG
ncbi:MAG: glycosyltransferase family 39 protein [Dehalococcoidia bacterium]|nr:MAG: glycosyltransferase family 39 protein [Dehalococcoidia bacterium]